LKETSINGSREKTIEIVAGPNGSGKSTFGESYFLRTNGNAVLLNADKIASGIAPLDFEKASFQAGRLLIQEVKDRNNRLINGIVKGFFKEIVLDDILLIEKTIKHDSNLN
jgi:predicted ABC-type ATPase